MSRLRAFLLSMGLVIVVLLAQSVSQAQAPGGGGNRGGRGGGFGGFGGRTRISSPLTLASNKYVQEDLKLTDSQKEQVKALSDKVDEQRKAQRDSFARQRNGGGNPPANTAGATPPAGDAAKTDASSTKGRGGRTRSGPTAKNGDATKAGDVAKGADPNGGAAARGQRGGNNGNGFGNGPNGGGVDFRAMFERQQAETDAALAKILNKSQRDRIHQIQLQQEGPMAVTKPEMQTKLNMSPMQIEQIAMIVDERQQAQRNLFSQGRDQMAGFQSADGRFDFRAFQAKVQQDPQFKAEMDKNREAMTKQSTQLQDQSIAMIGKTLTKKQHQNFQKMQGPPFDLAKLDRNYDPVAAAAKEKEEAEAVKESANSKKSSASKKKTSAKTKRST